MNANVTVNKKSKPLSSLQFIPLPTVYQQSDKVNIQGDNIINKCFKECSKDTINTGICADVQTTTLTDLLSQSKKVAQVVLSLGSNQQAEKYLTYATKILANLGQMACSVPFVNPDFTATPQQPKPDYTNQCILLKLDSTLSLSEIMTLNQRLENDCQRQRQSQQEHLSPVSINMRDSCEDDGDNNCNCKCNIDEPTLIKQVTLDIDLLAVQLQNEDTWHRIFERYPFKNHEIVGLQALKLAARLV